MTGARLHVMYQLWLMTLLMQHDDFARYQWLYRHDKISVARRHEPSVSDRKTNEDHSYLISHDHCSRVHLSQFGASLTGALLELWLTRKRIGVCYSHPFIHQQTRWRR